MLFCHICGHQKKEFTCFTSVTWECTNENCGKPKEEAKDGDNGPWFETPYGHIKITVL
jgi:hypothetical protein